MTPPKSGEYADKVWLVVKELVEKMNALEHCQVKGTNVSGKLTYSGGQWVLEIQLS